MSHGVIFNAEDKKKQSEEVAAQTEAFLNKGGKVEQISEGGSIKFSAVKHLNKGKNCWAVQDQFGNKITRRLTIHGTKRKTKF